MMTRIKSSGFILLLCLFTMMALGSSLSVNILNNGLLYVVRIHQYYYMTVFLNAGADSTKVTYYTGSGSAVTLPANQVVNNEFVITFNTNSAYVKYDGITVFTRTGSVSFETVSTTYYLKSICNYNDISSYSTVATTVTYKGSCSTGSVGDPHFRTWGGINFDYMGQCDLILLTNAHFINGQTFTIFIRTLIERWWSFISNVAIEIGNDVLEIQVNGGTLLVNGQIETDDVVNISDNVSLVKHSHTNMNTNTHHFTFVLMDSGNEIFQVNGVDGKKKEMGVLIHHPTSTHFAGSLGLLGSYPSGETIAQDGTTVITDTNAFGESWRVQGEKVPLVFQEEAHNQDNRCTYPTEAESLSMMSIDQAQHICENNEDFNDFCVQDLMSTGDYEIAEIYNSMVYEGTELLSYEAKVACSRVAKYESFCVKEVMSTGNLSVAEDFVELE